MSGCRWWVSVARSGAHRWLRFRVIVGSKMTSGQLATLGWPIRRHGPCRRTLGGALEAFRWGLQGPGMIAEGSNSPCRAVGKQHYMPHFFAGTSTKHSRNWILTYLHNYLSLTLLYDTIPCNAWIHAVKKKRRTTNVRHIREFHPGSCHQD